MSASAGPSLQDRIRAEIARQGPIPFRRFMELALYDEREGYYRRSRQQRGTVTAPTEAPAGLGAGLGPTPPAQADPFGVSGDYFTNSQLQPVFGRLIAQRIACWREELGSPSDFSVLELGPGRGETTAVLRERLPGAGITALDCAPEGFSASNGPDAVHGYGLREYVPTELSEAGYTGVVFSNEFFDALPVHSVEKRGGDVIEHYVEQCDGHRVLHAVGQDSERQSSENDARGDGAGFRFVDGPVSDPRVAEYLAHYVPALADGQRIEVNLAALEFLERIASSIVSGGYVLTIDYGYTADQIAGGRRFPRGSLMSYFKHQASEDVLGDPGGRDITAHVNFTALEKRGAELGLESQGLQTQTQFLMETGEPDQFAAALEAGSEQESFRLRMQLKTLLFGLGETFQVLVQRKL